MYKHAARRDKHLISFYFFNGHIQNMYMCDDAWTHEYTTETHGD